MGDAALTGPVARGDAGTVAEHRRALAASRRSRCRYLALARRTADRALAAGSLTAADAHRLLEVLAGAPVMPIGAHPERPAPPAHARLPGRLVPTMGALHEGHRALIGRARELADLDGIVVVTMFVNPLQFGPSEDLDRYPRTLDDDVAIGAERGRTWCSRRRSMYPRPSWSPSIPGRWAGSWRGVPAGHFSGVLTVVAKLLQLTRPDAAFFGEKDSQQLALIRRMVPVSTWASRSSACRPCASPTASRSPAGTGSCPRPTGGPPLPLPAALRAGQEAAPRRAGRGPQGCGRDPGDHRGPAPAAGLPGAVDPDTFEQAGEDYAGPARLLVAARVGTTRLIDNTPLSLERHAADD